MFKLRPTLFVQGRQSVWLSGVSAIVFDEPPTAPPTG